MVAVLKSPENVRMGIVVESIESAGAEAGIKAINTTYLAASAEKLVLNSYPTIFTIDVQAGRVSYYAGSRSAKDLVAMARAAAIATGAKSTSGGSRRGSRRGSRATRRVVVL